LPGPQVRAVLTGLQAKTPVDLSGVIISEKTIAENGQHVKLYVMKPEHVAGRPPVLLFIHGGVWIAGDFENHKRLVRDLVTLMAKDRGGPNIRLQVLLIPATDTNFDTKSYNDFDTGRFLPRAFMQFGWNIYAPDEKTRSNPYAVPMRATVDQLRGLPKALVITAENDPLRDEGEAYARRLKEAGVDVTATRYNGMIHDFVLLNGIKDVAGTQAAIKQASDAIRDALKK
jgi:acetyl esterase/lipase